MVIIGTPTLCITHFYEFSCIGRKCACDNDSDHKLSQVLHLFVCGFTVSAAHTSFTTISFCGVFSDQFDSRGKGSLMRKIDYRSLVCGTSLRDKFISPLGKGSRYVPVERNLLYVIK